MIKFVPFGLLIPNIITLSGLVIGISSIKFALVSRWEVAICCILFAAILDGLDGRIARILNSSSKFGSELDSLCDLANFGVAPPILIYLWAFNYYEFHLISWGSSMFFAACITIRLAKFNLLNESNTRLFLSDRKQHHKNAMRKVVPERQDRVFFYGMPAPAAAILLLIPIMLEFNLENLLNDKIRGYKVLLNFYVLFIGFLAAGNFRTISLKNFKINKNYLSVVMSLLVILIISIIIYPWHVIPTLGLLYLINIPIYIIWLRYYKRQ